MFKRIKHWFGVHDWYEWVPHSNVCRKCEICGHCEMQMADKSWARALGLESTSN